MYFPFFLARGEEVEAILATICNYPDNKVIPILQPYTTDEDDTYSYARLVKVVNALVKNQKNFILIVQNEEDLNLLKKTLDNGEFDKYCIYGFYNTNENFRNVSQGKQIAILHEGEILDILDNDNIRYHIFLPTTVSNILYYISKYSKEKIVVIEDGFNKQVTNQLYPSLDIFKSRLCLEYKKMGIVGFGDYTVIGQDSTPGGGGNMNYITHVIHLTTENSQRLEVRHYLTTPIEEPNSAERSRKTLEKAYIEKDKFMFTSGIKMLEDKYHAGTTSLGTYKRIGMLNHIDVIYNILNRS